MRDWVNESQRLGVECLARTGFEAVLNELGIFGGGVAAQNFVAAISGVVKERVPDVLHVHSDLVGSSGFELAAHHSHMPEVFERVIVRHGMLAHVAFGENSHLQAVLQAAPDVAFNSAVDVLHFAPHHSHILAFGGFVEELQSEVGFCPRRLCNHQQTRGVLVDAVHEPHARVAHVVVGVVLEMIG